MTRVSSTMPNLAAGALTAADFRRLAALHLRCLPDSLVSRMGERYAGSFYRYVARSGREHLLVEREAGEIVGACVISSDPDSLNRRLIVGSGLVAAALTRVHRLPLGAIVRESLASDARPADPRPAGWPELILIFTDPAGRGRGVGTRLMSRSEELVGQHGHRGFWLKTLDDPANRALDFYRGRGMSPSGRLSVHGRPFQVWVKAAGVGGSAQGGV